MDNFGPPEKLKKNEFWGKRGGSYDTTKPKGSDKPWGAIIKIPRGSTKISDNKGPTGHKNRWYFERAMSANGKPIRNPEHQKKGK